MIPISTYVIADIHGQYDMFLELLDKIKLKESDTLYILGDILDRGPHPIKVLQKIMEMPNAIPLVGNHELMALECLEFLCREITEDDLADLDEKVVDNILTWEANGCRSTLDEFYRLSPDMRQEVMEFLGEFLLYEELSVCGKEFLLVHGGLGNYAPDKDIEDYSLEELVWSRADYETRYYEDVYVVTGHTPTQTIDQNPRSGYIYRHKGHIAIDCGSCFPGGRLAAICLDTGEEFYSSTNEAPGKAL